MDYFKHCLALMLLFWSTHLTEQQCPSGLFLGTFREDHPIGSILFNLTVDTSLVNLTIEPDNDWDPRPEDPNGYLELTELDEPIQHVRLARSLLLDDLNPSRPRAKPTTSEDLPCNYTGIPDRTPDKDVKRVQYKIKCKNLGDPIEISSSIIMSITDLNDHAPYFQCAPYVKKISEQTLVGSPVFTLRGLATDDDYEIESPMSYGFGEPSGTVGKFAMRSASAQDGRIDLVGELDYDYGDKSYTLNVTANDGMFPNPKSNWTTLTIEVTDADDQDPVFTEEMYTLTLPEGSSDMVGQNLKTEPAIRAYDKDRGIDQPVHYDIVRGNNISDVSYFKLNITTGEVIPLQVLNRENIKQFNMRIMAYQTDKPLSRRAYASLTIDVEDVNDNKPIMTSHTYNVTIPENLPEGLLVTQVSATDADEGSNAEFEYKIMDTSGGFQLDSTTGIVSVLNSNLLDRETNQYFEFTVYAQETKTEEKFSSNSSRVYVTLSDVNDNAPVFQQPSGLPGYLFKVRPSMKVNHTVGYVYANDTDEGANAEVRYDVQFGSPGWESTFHMDSINGRVSLKRIPQEDFYFLGVRATDQALPARLRRSSTVSLDIWANETVEKPRFEQDLYTVDIYNSHAVNSSIIQVYAGPMTYNYAILGGNNGSIFAINHTNGVIYLAKSVAAFPNVTFQLHIIAHNISDITLNDTTKVKINILEETNIPVFYQRQYNRSIIEEEVDREMIVDLNTTDESNGKPIKYSILSGNTYGVFSINATTGVVYREEQIDRENTSSFNLLVRCDRLNTTQLPVRHLQDKNRPLNKAILNIDIEDINDNYPSFYYSPILAGVPPDVSYGYLIYTVQAYDRDSGNNSALAYRISGPDSKLFEIQPSTGDLTSKGNFINSGKQELKFKVSVVDNYGQGLSTNTSMTIKVLPDSQRAILVAGIPPSKFKENQAVIIRNLSAILGWDVRMEKLESHEENGKVDVERTDMYFHAVDTEGGRIVPKDELLKRIEEKADEIRALFDSLEANVVTVKAIPSVMVPYTIGAVQAGFLALGCIIFLGSLIGVIVVIYSWKKRKYENDRTTHLMHTLNNAKRNPAISNPAFDYNLKDEGMVDVGDEGIVVVRESSDDNASDDWQGNNHMNTLEGPRIENGVIRTVINVPGITGKMQQYEIGETEV
ncbi:unnamed protein product [Owenia fusiformis]|uniref:Cadherin domain-containing protein n=1 Tax=Owenia fusiformis TaxID=6347 RepID=A0A8S4PQY5_OWEFU|nr:unnamed protein product [Owenia fusiformis]